MHKPERPQAETPAAGLSFTISSIKPDIGHSHRAAAQITTHMRS